MTRCVYDKFVWDHRLLWIELPLAVAFGHTVPPTVRAAARQLKCKDPRIVNKYLEEYVMWIEHFGSIEKAQRLQEGAGSLPEWLVKQEYDQLDKIRFDAMMFADKHCWKLKMGAKQWTPNYQLARDKVTMWKLIVQRKQGKRVHTRYLLRLVKKCGESDAMASKLEEALDNRLLAYRHEKILAKATEVTR